MRITLERSNLLKSLNHVHRVVERRNTIPILSNVLLRADGQALGSIDDLMAVRRTHLVGDTITLTVLRAGQTFDVDVPLYASAD